MPGAGMKGRHQPSHPPLQQTRYAQSLTTNADWRTMARRVAEMKLKDTVYPYDSSSLAPKLFF